MVAAFRSRSCANRIAAPTGRRKSMQQHRVMPMRHHRSVSVRAATQKVTIASVRHPSGTGEVRVVHTAGPFGFAI